MKSVKRVEALNNILSDAIEGSISYWAHIDEVDLDNSSASAVDWFYRSATISDMEEPDVKYVIDINTIAKGLNLVLKNKDERWNALRKYNATNGDDGDYDAYDCDAIIQYALFGELVYA